MNITSSVLLPLVIVVVIIVVIAILILVGISVRTRLKHRHSLPSGITNSDPTMFIRYDEEDESNNDA